MTIMKQDLKRLDNLAKAYHTTVGDMQEMWKKKWYQLIKIVASKITQEKNDKSERFTTDPFKIH